MKNFIFALVAIILLAGAACRKSAPQPQNSNTSSFTQTQDVPLGGTAKSGDRFYFRGTISDNLKIELTLLRDGTQLTGSYFYPKVGKDIALSGTIDKDGNFDLREKDDAGKDTGIFKGKWAAGADPSGSDSATLQGKWSRPDGSKETTFQATQQPISASADVRVVPKLIKDVNKESHYKIDVEFPEIDGDPRFDKFNKEARALITREVTAFKTAATSEKDDYGTDLPDEASTSTFDNSFEIKLATDDLVSVHFSEADFSRGAAHANDYSTVLNYDVKNGKKLALGDLFNAKSNYLKVLSDYCIKNLKQQSKQDKDSILSDDMIESGAAPRADNYQKWTITKKGLWVIFDPYQVGPFAAGPQFVLVPYSVLKDVIKPDGPVGNLAK